MSVYRRMLGRELPCGLKDLLNSYASANSDSPAVHCALTLESQSKHEEAAKILDKIEGAENAKAMLFCAAGFEYERAGAWRKAVIRYQRALGVNSAELFALHRLIAVFMANGRLHQAMEQLARLLSQWPGDKTARVCLAHLQMAVGNPQEAAWEYQQAMCLEPDSWELAASAAGTLHQANSDHAIEILEQLIQDQPQFPDLRMRLGNLYSLQGDDQSARLNFQRALSLHPEYLDCHISIARHELRMGRRAGALDHFNRAIRINELNVEMTIGLAVALKACGRTEQWADMIASASRIARNSAILTAQRAILRDTGKSTDLGSHTIDALSQMARQDLESHPYWTDVWMEYGMMRGLLGEQAQAMRSYVSAARSDSFTPMSWMLIGLELTRRDHASRASEVFATGLAFDPRRGKLEHQLALSRCCEHEFTRTIERLSDSQAAQVDAEHRILAILEEMSLTGLTRKQELSAI